MSPTPALWHKTVSPSLITRSYCSIHLIISLAGMIISSEYRHMIAAQRSFWHNILKTLGKQAPSLRNFCFFHLSCKKSFKCFSRQEDICENSASGCFLEFLDTNVEYCNSIPTAQLCMCLQKIQLNIFWSIYFQTLPRNWWITNGKVFI